MSLEEAVHYLHKVSAICHIYIYRSRIHPARINSLPTDRKTELEGFLPTSGATPLFHFPTYLELRAEPPRGLASPSFEDGLYVTDLFTQSNKHQALVILSPSLPILTMLSC